jgi:hypothetical protein
MLNTLFQGIFDKGTTEIAVLQFVLCILVSLLIGAFYAYIYSRSERSSQSFVVTLAILPAIVCVVIMMVNGNVGAGIAVAGAFSLVRFRSVPGTAKQIAMLFLAMGAGLVTGMGYLGYAILFSLLLSGAMVLFTKMGIGTKRQANPDKTLRITIPEDLNYSSLFDDLFEEYTTSHQVDSVKTTNMGSMFRLTYHIVLRDEQKEKEFIDELRCRNGNLEISIAGREANNYEL